MKNSEAILKLKTAREKFNLYVTKLFKGRELTRPLDSSKYQLPIIEESELPEIDFKNPTNF